MGNAHDDPVWQFLKEQRDADPDGYAELAAKYPILNGKRIKRLRWRERTVGLLGLHDCKLPQDVSFLNGLDYSPEEDDS